MLKDKGGAFPVIILTLICLITGALLTVTNNVTSDIIKTQELKTANDNRQSLFSTADDFKEIDISALKEKVEQSVGDKNHPNLTSAYEALSGGKIVGYIFESDYKGYGGQVPVMTGIDVEKNIIGIRILSNEETPGLGKKIEEPKFQAQFNEKPAVEFVLGEASSDQISIDAIAGATFSSEAVIMSLNAATKAFEELQK